MYLLKKQWKLRKEATKVNSTMKSRSEATSNSSQNSK